MVITLNFSKKSPYTILNNFEQFKDIAIRSEQMKSLTRQEEQILLVIHRLGEHAYLVNIRDELKDMTGKYFDVGTIYVPLKRLDQRGYLADTIKRIERDIILVHIKNVTKVYNYA